MAFKDFIADLFDPLGGVSLRPMFGGTALMRDGRMFAFTLRDVLYFKTDSQSEARYRAEGAEQFAYAGMKGREVAMPYWQAPLRLLDDQDELLAWAREAVEVSQRTGKAKKTAGKIAASRKSPAKGKQASKTLRAKKSPGPASRAKR